MRITTFLPPSLLTRSLVFLSLLGCFVTPLRSAENPVDRGKVKVATVQISGYDKGDPRRDDYEPAHDLVPYIEKAGQEGSQLVVFPEYILGRISVPGPTTQIIAAAAAAQKIYVIVGCWEEYEDGTFANTALLFDRAGRIHGKYHKTHAAVDHFEGSPPWSRPPSQKDRDWFLRKDPEWIMKKGSDLPVFDLDFAKVGILTCYDGWFPEPFHVLSLKGAELIVWINGRGGVVEDFIVKTAMFQSHVAMITANQAYGGGTMIGDPAKWPTQILAHGPNKGESYLSATIDLAAVRRIRGNSRNFQQRRPDLYGTLAEAKPALARQATPDAEVHAGEEPAPVPLWPGVAPGSEGQSNSEMIEVLANGERKVSSIHQPSLIPYVPAPEKATGAAVIIAPGGAHRFLCVDHEGCHLGTWLRERGIAAFVLKNRLAKEANSPYRIDVEALADTQRALRLVRSRAHEWNVIPSRVGVLGFSAGGELAALVSARNDPGLPEAADVVERESCRPDFQALIYPGRSGDIQPTSEAPPIFLVCGYHDRRDISEGLADLYLRFKRAGVPAELHIYSDAGHGFGVRTTTRGAVKGWPARFEEWLDDRGFLTGAW